MTTIRAAALTDVDSMGECMVRSWLYAHNGQIPADLYDERVRSWTPAVSARGWERVLDEIGRGLRSSGTLLVAEADGSIVGVGLITAHGAAAEIDALYVLPEWHHKRVGTGLIRHLAQAVVARCATVELSVLEANAPARRFYERLGGVQVADSTVAEGAVELPALIYRWATGDLIDD